MPRRFAARRKRTDDDAMQHLSVGYVLSVTSAPHDTTSVQRGLRRRRCLSLRIDRRGPRRIVLYPSLTGHRPGGGAGSRSFGGAGGIGARLAAPLLVFLPPPSCFAAGGGAATTTWRWAVLLLQAAHASIDSGLSLSLSLSLSPPTKSGSRRPCPSIINELSACRVRHSLSW